MSFCSGFTTSYTATTNCVNGAIQVTPPNDPYICKNGMGYYNPQTGVVTQTSGAFFPNVETIDQALDGTIYITDNDTYLLKIRYIF